MRKILFTVFLLTLASLSVQAQSKSGKKKQKGPQIVEASCGKCNFDLPGDGCKLAVRIEDKAYYVTGSTLADHGDEHGDEGMCNVVRQAKVEGKVVLGVFKAKSFELLPSDPADE